MRTRNIFKRLKCWIYGHRVNTYLIESTPRKKCIRCGKEIYDWAINHYQMNKDAIDFTRKQLGKVPKKSRA